MNTKLKNFIFNGLTYGIVFFILSFIIGYSGNLALKDVTLMSAAIGAIAFLINGLMQSRFTKSSKTLHIITISLQDAEELKIAAPANHVIEEHLISGKLFLTQKRLVFKSFQQEEYCWPLTDIHSFKFHSSIFNTGGEFIVVDDNQGKFAFEVDEIKAWKRALLNSKKNDV